MTRDDNWLNDVASMQILGPRGRQEDSALHVRLGRGRLIVVADGMGGEPAGDIASMAAVLGFEKGFGAPADGFENNMTWAMRFMDGLRGAQDAMNAAVGMGHGLDGMATTLVAVWADPDGLRWINVGDSSIWGAHSRSPYLRPVRLTGRHGEGNRVQSGLIPDLRFVHHLRGRHSAEGGAATVSRENADFGRGIGYFGWGRIHSTTAWRRQPK